MEVSTFIPKLQYSYIVVLIEDVQFSLVHSQYSLRGICLSGGNYFRGRFIVSGQFSGGGGGGQFSLGAIVQVALIPRGKLSGGAIFLGSNCPACKFPQGQLSEHLVGNCPGGNCPDTLFWIFVVLAALQCYCGDNEHKIRTFFKIPVSKNATT